METLLVFLPTIFSFFTGLLISWGVYLGTVMILFSPKFDNDTHNLIKYICLGCLCTMNIGLLSLLFIFTGFAAFHMVTILFIEIWYADFLYRMTITPWNTPCHTILRNLSSKDCTKST